MAILPVSDFKSSPHPPFDKENFDFYVLVIAKCIFLQILFFL